MDHGKPHPVLIAAGVAVLVFSLLGAAALTGLLPVATSKSEQPGAATTAQASRVPARSHVAQLPVQQRDVQRCQNCGVVEAIRAVEVQGDASGLGAVAGGVAGAVVGNQFGRGNGNTVMTIAGAAGGAYAGNAIEKNMKKQTAYRVTVRLEDGTVRTLSQPSLPPFAIGDRVRVVNGSGLERA